MTPATQLSAIFDPLTVKIAGRNQSPPVLRARVAGSYSNGVMIGWPVSSSVELHATFTADTFLQSIVLFTGSVWFL